VPIISAFRQLKQKDLNFEACLNYITRSCLKKEKRKKDNKKPSKLKVIGKY
jgi:hypothetical protein